MPDAKLEISVLDTDAMRLALSALAKISQPNPDEYLAPQRVALDTLDRIAEMTARSAA